MMEGAVQQIEHILNTIPKVLVIEKCLALVSVVAKDPSKLQLLPSIIRLCNNIQQVHVTQRVYITYPACSPR